MPPARRPIFHTPAKPSERACRRCGIFAHHRYAKECLDDLKLERAALLKLARALERHGGITLACPWCRTNLEQLKAASTRKDCAELRRVYWCQTCRECLVTHERPSISSLYRSAGLQKPNAKGAEPSMLAWDKEAVERILGVHRVGCAPIDIPVDLDEPPGGW